MQGAFWIVMAGHGLEMEAKKLMTPSEEDAQIMAENNDPYGCCASCHNDLDGPFYQTDKVCVGAMHVGTRLSMHSADLYARAVECACMLLRIYL